MLVFLLQSPLAAARVIEFAYQERELLGPGHPPGARIWLPDGEVSDRSLTPIVLLHGLNGQQRICPLLDPDRVDLGATAAQLIEAGEIRPDFLLAAPTQLRRARQTDSLWHRFDLRHFLAAVRSQLPRGVRLAGRPIVMGHSGAACSPESGLWWIVAREGGWLKAVVVIDTCVNAGFGELLWYGLWPGRGLPGFCQPPPPPEPLDPVCTEQPVAPPPHPLLPSCGEPWPVGLDAPIWVPPAICYHLAYPRHALAKSWLLHFWQAHWRRPVTEFEEALHLELWQEEGPRGMFRLKRNERRWLSARVEAKHSEVPALAFAEAARRLFATPAMGELLDEEFEAGRREWQAHRRRTRPPAKSRVGP